MGCLRKLLALIAILITGLWARLPIEKVAAAEVDGSEPTGRTLRFYSMAIRDLPPTLAETQAFLAGSTTLDELITTWLATPEHQTRMRRYFSDSWPVLATFTPFYFLTLEKNASGIYRLAEKPDCGPADAVSAPAWWLPEGETVSICKTSTSDAFSYAGDPKLNCYDYFDGFLDPKCGCGPHQLMCEPKELRLKLAVDNNNEIQRRGLYVYNNDLSWFDFLGGNFFYGNRSLYHLYLWEQGLMQRGLVPVETVLTALRSIPLVDWVRADFPPGVERAGIVTSSTFLSTYNTFYARPRALSLNLLCHDVDGRLNPDDFKEFVNKSLTVANLDHAKKEKCNTCHFGLDNLASALFGYDAIGDAELYLDPFPSQAAHVFGENVSGPGALIKGFIERAAGFHECMAKTAWTSLTGLSWANSLSKADRDVFTGLAQTGPRALTQGIIKSSQLRTGGYTPTAAVVAPTVTWAQVAPIVAKSCSGSSCHSTGSFHTQYVDNESLFRERAKLIAERVALTGGGKMPPLSAAHPLSAADQQTILDFANSAK